MPASDDMTMTMFCVFLAILGVAALFFLFRNSSGGIEAPAKEKAKDVPARDLEEEYKLGMDPCASGKPVMYTLQTCLHCVHLKHFLDDHGISHHLVYVDDFEGDQRRELMAKVRSLNPRGSFPTLVLPDGRVSVGFRETQIRKLFDLA